MGTKSRSDVTFTNKQLIAGLEQYYGKKSVVLAGKTWTSAAIITALQKEDALVASAATARAAWSEQVTALRAQSAANNQLRKELHAAVVVNYGANQAVLSTFGYVPQSAKPTLQTKATAAQKRNATRAARHIMGSKQRKALQAAPVTPAAAPSTAATK